LFWGSPPRQGDAIRRRYLPFKERERDDLTVVIGAMLTLLGLLIGFAFSMAVTRCDQRKNLEEAEANSIGTEYVRAHLLPTQDAVHVRELLKRYLDQRAFVYTTHEVRELAKVNADTADLQNQLWLAVRSAAASQQTPVMALAVSGMNDVLSSQGNTQAGWWNRIPTGGLGPEDRHCHLLQPAARIRRAPNRSPSIDHSAARGIPLVSPHLRYR
jgi:hypothetical protein